MGGNDTSLAESVVEELEVRLLEQALGRALGVRRVGDDDTTVTAANYQDLLRVGVGVHGKVGDHLLVAALSSTIVRAFQLGVTYENSSRSVHWMTLSRTRTVP